MDPQRHIPPPRTHSDQEKRQTQEHGRNFLWTLFWIVVIQLALIGIFSLIP